MNGGEEEWFSVKSNEIIDLGKDYQMALKPLDVWLMGTHHSYRFTVQSNKENPHMMEGLESTPNPAVNLIFAQVDHTDNSCMIQCEGHTSHDVFWPKMFNLNPSRL